MSLHGWGVLGVLSLCWGSAFLLIKLALPGFQPFSIVFWRLVLAVVVLLIITRLRGFTLPRGWAVWRLLIILGLIHNALPFTLVAWGQKSVTSSLTSIFMATIPLWSIAAAPFFLRDENLNRHSLIGIVLGFLGVIIIIGVDGLSDLGSELPGQLAILLATLCLATSHILGRRVSHLPPLAAASSQLICASFFMLPLVIIFDRPWNLPIPDINSIAAVIALAAGSTALAFVLYYYSLALQGVINTSLVAFLIPIVGVLLGITFLDEQLTVAQIMGMLAISLAVLTIDGRPQAFLFTHISQLRRKPE